MCGITGFIAWGGDLTRDSQLLVRMTESLAHRGPDSSGTWISNPCAFGHRRLSVIDPENGAQPMIIHREDQVYAIVYNGELYNAADLKQELLQKGYRFKTNCDTEVLLVSYIEWGPDCLERLNGIFAFAVWDGMQEQVFLARDRVGVKPLFYSYKDGTLIFGSEPKALLQHPKLEAAVGPEGLAEVFIVGPARTPGHGVYRDLAELRPGQAMIFDRQGLKKYTYWKLESLPHEENEAETAARLRELLLDTVERQLVSDVPICSLLSGGLDSSALSAIAAGYYKRSGQDALHTYSVDYVDNDRHFQSHAFQPGADGPWIRRMHEELGTVHHWIEFDTPELVEALETSTRTRDLPGMADVDASLLLFCREIKKGATVAISGEAADEIFGGYPWFHREEMLNAGTFPWSVAPGLRESLLSPEVREWIRPMEYLSDRYSEALAEVPPLPGETGEQVRMREMSYLNITRFMPTLLDRKDRMSMGMGLEVRVPYTDHRLIEYVWNIPWNIKTAGGREKGILRKALEGILPDDVLYRKKSPYPKTHNPSYLAAVKQQTLSILDDPSSPILPLVDAAKIREIAASPEASSHLPWFGQLLSGPQLFAYLTQVNYWLKEYNVAIR